MKLALISFGSLFFFQITSGQGILRGTDNVQPVTLLMGNRAPTIQNPINTRIAYKTPPLNLPMERMGSATKFVVTSRSPGDIPIFRTVSSLPYIHVPGFLVAFPIPIERIFSHLHWGKAASNRIQINGGIIRRNEGGLTINFK